MTLAFEFILNLFTRCYEFMRSCVFVFYNYSVNLFDIFLFFILLSVILTVFWKGGKY